MKLFSRIIDSVFTVKPLVLLFCKKNFSMIDLDYLISENILTDNRKEKFLKVAKRTNHFTIAVEDIFQMHNTSAVMQL
jgi:hypothetical protein